MSGFNVINRNTMFKNLRHVLSGFEVFIKGENGETKFSPPPASSSDSDHDRIFPDVHDAAKPQLSSALNRLKQSGVDTSQVDYVGAGGQSLVFKDKQNKAYKVGRWGQPGSLESEAEALHALQDTDAAKHVPKFHAYDSKNDVLVREHVEGRKGGWSDGSHLQDIFHKKIVPALKEKEFSRPEWKEDSFVHQGDPTQAKMIDLGFVNRTGQRAYNNLLSQVSSSDPGRKSDSLFDLGMELKIQLGSNDISSEQAMHALNMIEDKFGEERTRDLRREVEWSINNKAEQSGTITQKGFCTSVRMPRRDYFYKNVEDPETPKSLSLEEGSEIAGPHLGSQRKLDTGATDKARNQGYKNLESKEVSSLGAPVQGEDKASLPSSAQSSLTSSGPSAPAGPLPQLQNDKESAQVSSEQSIAAKWFDNKKGHAERQPQSYVVPADYSSVPNPHGVPVGYAATPPEGRGFSIYLSDPYKQARQGVESVQGDDDKKEGAGEAVSSSIIENKAEQISEYQDSPEVKALREKPIPREKEVKKMVRRSENGARLLGAGNFGSVYGLDGPPPHAIKFGGIGEQEAEVMQSLEKIPGISPRLYKSSDQALVMELIQDHKTLWDRMFEIGPEEYSSIDHIYGFDDTMIFKHPQIAEVARKSFGQLRKMHEEGLVHGDFHPGNTVFDKEENVRIIDFGLAKKSNFGALEEATRDRQTNIAGEGFYSEYVSKYLDAISPECSSEYAELQKQYAEQMNQLGSRFIVGSEYFEEACGKLVKSFYRDADRLLKEHSVRLFR